MTTPDLQHLGTQLAIADYTFKAVQQGTPHEEVRQHLGGMYRTLSPAGPFASASRPLPDVWLGELPGGDRAPAAVVRDGDQVYVYFHPANLEIQGEGARNLEVAFKPEQEGGNTHLGFNKALYDEPKRPFLTQLGIDIDRAFAYSDAPRSHMEAIGEKVAEACRQITAEGKTCKPVMTAGYSRGGALAHMATQEWMAQGDIPVAETLAVVTPRYGDPAYVPKLEALAAQSGTRVIRLDIGGDEVVQAPKGIGYAAAAGTHVYIPQKLGEEAILNPTDATQQCDRLLIDAARDAGTFPKGYAYHGHGEQSRIDIEARLHGLRERTVTQTARMEPVTPELRSRDDEAVLAQIRAQPACLAADLDQAHLTELGSPSTPSENRTSSKQASNGPSATR